MSAPHVPRQRPVAMSHVNLAVLLLGALLGIGVLYVAWIEMVALVRFLGWLWR